MSIEEKIKTAKEDSWLKDSVSEKEFKEIKYKERRMKEIETYYMVNSASCSYGAYDCFEDAIEQSEKIDGNVKTITKVTETREIVWEKPDYAITKEEVLQQLKYSFEYDKVGYLSKDAIDWLIKKLKGEKE